MGGGYELLGRRRLGVQNPGRGGRLYADSLVRGRPLGVLVDFHIPQINSALSFCHRGYTKTG